MGSTLADAADNRGVAVADNRGCSSAAASFLGEDPSATETDDRRTCPTCNGCGHIVANFYVDSVEHWSQRLYEERWIDRAAIMDWAALYCASPFRKSQALEILHKVLKKEHGGPAYAVRNPSGFIATSVKDAWHKADPAQSSSDTWSNSWWER